MINLRFVTAVAACVFLSGPSSVPTAQALLTSKTHNNFNPVKNTLHYTRAQGERIIAVSWLDGLKQPRGKSFQSSGVARYGYTPMKEPSENLLDAFPVSSVAAHPVNGLTSFACRTPEIAVFGTRYSFDTTPTRADFNGRLLNSNALEQASAIDDDAFEAFSREILDARPEQQKSRTWQKTQITL
jgi:hypothetical protein